MISKHTVLTAQKHRIIFSPSGRSIVVTEGTSILEAARLASEPLPAECGGRGACGKCLALVLEGDVPEYRVIHRKEGLSEILACQTTVRGPLTVHALVESELPKLISCDQSIGMAPLEAWAPWPLKLDPPAHINSSEDLGVAVDIGTTTVRLLLIRLVDGVIVGEASAYNPQISWGADVISRIIAAEKGRLDDLAELIRRAISAMILETTTQATDDADLIRAYVVAGNLTMIHLLLGIDPSGIRRVPSEPAALAFEPVDASSLGWPGRGGVMVHTIPAIGGWVGGDIVSGILRIGLPRQSDGISLYVDLGTNGEIAVGGADFAMACACSAGPAFEGSGIRCGMRADQGAIDGAVIDMEKGTLELSIISGGAARGICGSGLISLADALFRAGWIDRIGHFTDKLPDPYRLDDKHGRALRLSQKKKIALWERDLAGLIRAKAAIFSGIRTLLDSLGIGAGDISRLVVSGNFGRFLNLPAAAGIGLLPDLPPEKYVYVDNGSLEGAALALLSKDFMLELESYLRKITYMNLSEVPSYMDEFVSASFLPHTYPEKLKG